MKKYHQVAFLGLLCLLSHTGREGLVRGLCRCWFHWKHTDPAAVNVVSPSGLLLPFVALSYLLKSSCSPHSQLLYQNRKMTNTIHLHLIDYILSDTFILQTYAFSFSVSSV